jgi:hypothetical protein
MYNIRIGRDSAIAHLFLAFSFHASKYIYFAKFGPINSAALTILPGNRHCPARHPEKAFKTKVEKKR